MSVVERLVILVLVILASIVGLITLVLIPAVIVLVGCLFVVAMCISYVYNIFIWLWNTIFNKNAKYLSCSWLLS